MSSWIELVKRGELADGTMKQVIVEKREILVARVGDRYYAADNRCPHMGAPLSDGTLEGTVVTCPRHGSRFDLINGQVVQWLKTSGLISTVSKALKPPRPLKVYQIKVEGDWILVEFQPPA